MRVELSILTIINCTDNLRFGIVRSNQSYGGITFQSHFFRANHFISMIFSYV